MLSHSIKRASQFNIVHTVAELWPHCCCNTVCQLQPDHFHTFFTAHISSPGNNRIGPVFSAAR